MRSLGVENNNYKTDARKAASGNIESCITEDVEVTLIDKTQASNPTKREYYWMGTLKTFYPDGLNLDCDY